MREEQARAGNFYRLGIGIFWVLTLALAGVLQGQIPDHIWSPESADSLPVWVSETGFMAGESLHWELLPIEAEAELRKKLERASKAAEENRGMSSDQETAGEECHAWIVPPPKVAPGKTLDKLVRSSVAIISGVIIDSSQGFYSGRLGTLYQVSVNQVIKRFPAYPELETIFLFFPEARIEIGGLRLCATARRDFSKPEVGQNILWFESKVDRAHSTFVSPRPELVVFEEAEGAVSFPAHTGGPKRAESFLAFEEKVEAIWATAIMAVAHPGLSPADSCAPPFNTSISIIENTKG